MTFARTCLALLCVWSCGMRGARGAPLPPKQPAARTQQQLQQQLIDRGLAALQKKEYALATQELSAAYRRAPSVELQFHLGAAALGSGLLIEAQDRMGHYLAELLPGGPPRSDAQQAMMTEAQRILALPRPPCGLLTVLGERGALLSIDGRPRAVLPLVRPLLVPAGESTVEIAWKSAAARERIEVPAHRMAELRISAASGTALLSVFPAVLLKQETTVLPEAVPPLLAQAAESSLRAERMSVVPDAAGGNAAYRLLIRAEQPGADNRLWSFALSLIDTEVADTAASANVVCEECDADKAVALLQASLKTLLPSGRMRQRGVLKITSEPSGAQVRTPERALGVTPLEHPLWAGMTDIIVVKREYGNSYHKVFIRPGATEPLHAVLSPESPDLPPALDPQLQTLTLRPPRWRLGLGAIAIGAGAVMLTLGAQDLSALSSVNCEGLAATACSEVLRSGVPLTTVGGAALIGGVVLLALPGRTVQVTVAPKKAQRDEP